MASKTTKKTARVRGAVGAQAKQSIRRSKPAATQRAARIAQALRRLELVSKQGARNKLPGATSDHSFLYGDDGAPR